MKSKQLKNKDRMSVSSDILMTSWSFCRQWSDLQLWSMKSNPEVNIQVDGDCCRRKENLKQQLLIRLQLLYKQRKREGQREREGRDGGGERERSERWRGREREK